MCRHFTDPVIELADVRPLSSLSVLSVQSVVKLLHSAKQLHNLNDYQMQARVVGCVEPNTRSTANAISLDLQAPGDRPSPNAR